MGEVDKHSRPNGNITVVEDCITVPFDIRRIYYLYDVPGGEERPECPARRQPAMGHCGE